MKKKSIPRPFVYRYIYANSPELARWGRMRIVMLWGEQERGHGRPHFTAFHGGRDARVELFPDGHREMPARSFEVIGDLSPRITRRLMAWVMEHYDEILDNWRRLQRHEAPVRIPPPRGKGR